MSEPIASMYMFSLLLVSVCCPKIWIGLELPLFVERLAEGESGLLALIG